MSKIISQLNATPDGFCGHTDVIADDELHEFTNGVCRTAGTALFGRVTYQLMESYWPAAAKDTSLPKSMFEFANLIDNVEKIVFSKTLKNVEWKKTTILTDINVETITDLKRKAKKDILAGGPSIISQLSKLGLIDEYYFLVQPIISGRGKRLFETIHLNERQKLKLVSTAFFKSGVVALHYETVH